MISSNRHSRCWLLCCGIAGWSLAIFAVDAAAAAATFRRIAGEVSDIAPDGTVLTTMHTVAPNGTVGPEINAFGTLTQARRISADSKTIAGDGLSPVTSHYNSWIRRNGGNYVPLGTFGGLWSFVGGMSEDGKIVVGSSTTASGEWRAFRWTSQSGMTPLPSPAGAASYKAYDISADGRTILGYATFECPECQSPIVAWDCAGECTPPTPSHIQSVLWTESGEIRMLGPLRYPPPNPTPGSKPRLPYDTGSAALSDDGTTVVGQLAVDNGTETFVWRAETGMQTIPTLNEMVNSELYPFDISGDGSGIVGKIGQKCGNGCESGPGAVIWDALHGVRSLKTVLVEEFGLGAQIGDGYLEIASRISADGRTIAGYYDRTNGGGSWMVTLPHPLHWSGLGGDYNNDGSVDASDYSFWRDRAGTNAALPNDDTAGVGQDDYARWRANFGRNLVSADQTTSALVPEPHTFVLLVAAASLVAAVNHRATLRS